MAASQCGKCVFWKQFRIRDKVWEEGTKQRNSQKAQHSTLSMANLSISLARITCYLTRLVLLTAWDVLIVDNRRSPAEELVAYCRGRFAAFPHPRAESGVFQVGLSDFFLF